MKKKLKMSSDLKEKKLLRRENENEIKEFLEIWRFFFFIHTENDPPDCYIHGVCMCHDSTLM